MRRDAVHIFTYKDQHLLYDGMTQTLLLIDEVTKAVATLYRTMSFEDMISELEGQFSIRDMQEAFEELDDLAKEQAIFYDEETFLATQKSTLPNMALSGLCLHVVHDCDLRCAYCFAGSGLYGGKPSYMSFEVAKQSIDFLLRQAAYGATLYIDFFGGEPTLNFAVIKETVAYGNEQAQRSQQMIVWSITTNGYALTDEMMKFINDNRLNVIVSVDGREQTHDHVRPDRKGRPTHATVIKHAKELYEKRQADMNARYGDGVYTYVRGTFTANNPDFAQDVIALYEQGFRRIAMEPVVSSPTGKHLAIQEQHLDEILQQYDRLVDFIAISRDKGDPLYFHHFELDLNHGPCLGKRASGCGAGTHYLAISPEGDIYPCHQFVGEKSFLMGNVQEDKLDEQQRHTFSEANTSQKAKCQTCFARYYCSGGCHANHYYLHGDVMQPDELSCRLIQKRVEAALYLEAMASL
nr:thioether cross-link-forming SCIFF peptide maturase [Bacilli bacterium]